MQGGAPGLLDKLVFPRRTGSSAEGWSGARSAAARGRSPSACAIAAFMRESIEVIWCNIENLIKLSQRFGKRRRAI